MGQQIVKTLAEFSREPWFVMNFPGLVVECCSLNLQQILAEDSQSADSLLTLLCSAVPSNLSEPVMVELNPPVCDYDHIRVVPVEDDSGWQTVVVFPLQAATRTVRLSAREILSALSSRQVDVLKRIYHGQTNKAIGLELGISIKTVEKHRAKVMTRLSAGSLAELVRIVANSGIAEQLNNPDSTYAA